VRFGFVLFPEVEELDLVGPWEMVGMWARAAGGPRERLLIAECSDPVPCANGMLVHPHSIASDVAPLDYLLVPGGAGARVASANEGLVRFIAEQAEHCKAVLAVCTGVFLLHRAGLLHGRSVTTHWAHIDELRALDGVSVVPERFCEDGPIWTSAGVSAGIDMLLAFIAKVDGEAAAGKVQLGAEYYPDAKRYGGLDRHPKAPEYVRRTAQRG
jgi:transcriptional regulator GlxA family with amidase domain